VTWQGSNAQSVGTTHADGLEFKQKNFYLLFMQDERKKEDSAVAEKRKAERNNVMGRH
jgi:hypothetical protein